MLTYEQLQAKYGELYDQELELEAHYKQATQDHLSQVLTKAKQDGQASTTAIGVRMAQHSHTKLSQAYQVLIKQAMTPKGGVKPAWHSILKDLDQVFQDQEALADMLALCCLTHSLNTIVANSDLGVLVGIAASMARDVQEEVEYIQFYKWLEDNDKKHELDILTKGMSSRISPHYRRNYLTITMDKCNYSPTKLPKQELQLLMVALLYEASDVLGWFTIEKAGAKFMPCLMPSQAFLEGWARNEDKLTTSAYSFCPTIIPPAPWESYGIGGYYGDLSPKNKMLRLSYTESIFQNSYRKLLNQTDLTPVLKALNGIQATPWIINKDVLDVVNEIVKRGGGLAGFPKVDEDPKPVVLSEEPTTEELEHYKSVMPAWYKSETRRKSIALRALSHVRTANEFVKYDKIYFPCNMDFRGRVYPIPTFNFQGDDLNKALILFADAPAFDSEEDADWFKITAANVAGHDKISYADRIKWAEDNSDNMLNVADDPLGYLWWADQDEPFQMLAICFEWKRYLSYLQEHDGSSIGFITGFPSHQDGTCSGLQHFSAILRDPVGGKAVNLLPSDKPSDIYALVAAEVNKHLEADLKTGTGDESVEKDGQVKIKYGTRTLAQLWSSFGVTRKVTKRPTMTLAYGAKEYGYRDQIMEDTIDPAIREQGEACVFNQYNKWQASAYMAKTIWSSIGKVVVKAVEGMKWLHDCSKKVAAEGKPVTWVTPLGLPVQQNYIEYEVKTTQLRVSGTRIRCYTYMETGNINKRKQTSSIAPNFIHSMDAAHLQLAIDYCLDAGIKHFSTIHDSYGCPMAQTKLMYKLVRQAFVDMYKDNDVLASFKEDIKLITSAKIPEIPAKGDLNIDIVKDSKYVFC